MLGIEGSKKGGVMKGIFIKSVFCLLTFFVASSINNCWAVKIKNVASPVYIMVDDTDDVLLTDDVNKATDFSLNNACEKTGKSVTITLTSDNNKHFGWTLDATVAIFLISMEPWLQLLVWRYDSKNKTLGWHWNERTAYLCLSCDADASISFTSHVDDCARWEFVS